MKKYVSLMLFCFLVIMLSCSKNEQKDCVCRDHAKVDKEVERFQRMNEVDCATQNLKYVSFNPDVECKLEKK